MTTLGKFIHHHSLKASKRDEAGTFIVKDNPKIKIQYFMTITPAPKAEQKRLMFLEIHHNKQKNGEEEGHEKHEADLSSD